MEVFDEHNPPEYDGPMPSFMDRYYCSACKQVQPGNEKCGCYKK
jgi:hypothetical protein